MMTAQHGLLKSALVAGFLATALLGACSDDPVSNDQATVTMVAELEGNASVNKTVAVSGAEADSVTISRIRILISELKLHRDKEDTVAGDKTVKTGPMLITIDSAGTRTFANGTVPAGSYDKLKFEFHRFSSSEVSQYLADTNFADFVTDDRYTFLIDMTVYKDGQAFPYTYRSNVTANLSLKFKPAITLDAGGNVIIVVQIDPEAVMKPEGVVLDPRDGANESKLDKSIKEAIKALKR